MGIRDSQFFGWRCSLPLGIIIIVQTLTFYLFSMTTIAAGVMVISAKNPVHSVLFLILAFFNSAGLFILLGAEFDLKKCDYVISYGKLP